MFFHTDPHSILAIYTNQLAETGVTNATQGALEEAVLDAEMDAMVAKYAPSVDGLRPRSSTNEAGAPSAPIVSSAAPVHVPSNAGEGFG